MVEKSKKNNLWEERGGNTGGGGGRYGALMEFWAAEVVSQLASADTRYVLIKFNTNSGLRL